MHQSLSEKKQEGSWIDQKSNQFESTKPSLGNLDPDSSVDSFYRTHSAHASICLWNSKVANFPDIETCNLARDSQCRRSSQVINTCQGTLCIESVQNISLPNYEENLNQNTIDVPQINRRDAKTSICLRRRRLSNISMERQVRDHLLVEMMAQISTPIYDCNYWIDHSADCFNHIEVDLSHNHLSQIPSSVISMAAKVEVLNLSHNRFNTFPEQLHHFTNLKVLDLSHNAISVGLPRDLASALTQLRVLRLYGNQITELPGNLGEMVHLETLQLGSIFGGNLLHCFPEKCISKLLHLRDLDLTQNQLIHLPTDIGHPHSRLERLTISENRLLSLPRSIGQCRLLRSFDLSRNSLLDLPIEITDLVDLETLDLTENNLCVIPGDITLFMSKTTVLLTGNPFTSGPRKSDLTFKDNEAYRRASVTRQSDSPQSISNDPLSSQIVSSNTISTQSSPIQGHSSLIESPTVLSHNPFLFPTLRELAARQILKYTISIPRHRLPISLLQYLNNGARPCCHCSNPYVREWVSCVEIKNYLGHPQIPRSVRFCSEMCMIQTKKSSSVLDTISEMNISPRNHITYQDPSPKPPIKPFSSRHVRLSNQLPIKSRKPSSIWNTKRMAVRLTTTDW